MVEHDALSINRDAYDAAAPAYVRLFRDTLADSPLDRAILGAFAEVVRASGNGRVADLGDRAHPAQVFDHAVAPAYRLR